MKAYLFVIVALFASYASATLTEDLAELGALLPANESAALVQDYINRDDETRAVLAYLQGPDFAALLARIETEPGWIALKEHMIGAGVDVDGGLQIAYDSIMNAGPNTEITSDNPGLASLVNEILNLISTDELINFLNDKLSNSLEFQQFWAVLSSEDTHLAVESIRQSAEYIYIRDMLLTMNVNLDEYIDLLYIFLGWA